MGKLYCFIIACSFFSYGVASEKLESLLSRLNSGFTSEEHVFLYRIDGEVRDVGYQAKRVSPALILDEEVDDGIEIFEENLGVDFSIECQAKKVNHALIFNEEVDDGIEVFEENQGVDFSVGYQAKRVNPALILDEEADGVIEGFGKKVEVDYSAFQVRRNHSFLNDSELSDSKES